MQLLQGDDVDVLRAQLAEKDSRIEVLERLLAEKDTRLARAGRADRGAAAAGAALADVD